MIIHLPQPFSFFLPSALFPEGRDENGETVRALNERYTPRVQGVLTPVVDPTGRATGHPSRALMRCLRRGGEASDRPD